MFVSVVMPVYNGQAFLREAIGSVLAQTHRDFELLAVDDGSTDDSPAILREVAAADSRLRVIRQENGGGARARNRALAEARAEWIVNLDQDDIMLPNRIERQLAFIAAQPDVKVTACRAYYINAAGKIFGQTKCEPITSREAFERYLASGEAIGIVHPGAALHRPTILALGGYRPAFEGAEDIDLWNRVAELGPVLQQDEVLMKYRIHASSVVASRTRQCWEKGAWAIACMQARRAGRPEPSWEAYRAELRTLPWWRRLQRERLMQARVHYRIAGFDLANRRWLRGAGHLLIAGAAKPSYVLERLAAQVNLPWQRTGAAGTRTAEAPAAR
jgi:glycosyltransferase involved in cell wall biosynthesis